MNAFLFAVSLLFEVDVPSLELSDAASMAAFAFVRALGAAEGAAHATAPAEEPQDPDEALALDWDEPTVLLPQELTIIWNGVFSVKRRLEVAAALANVPRYAEVPPEAPRNNPRQDTKAPLDRTLHNYQQQILHVLRVMS